MRSLVAVGCWAAVDRMGECVQGVTGRWGIVGFAAGLAVDVEVSLESRAYLWVCGVYIKRVDYY